MVDGEPVMIYKGLDALLSFYLSDGEHEISMRYVPRGLGAGAAISLISVICMLLAAAVSSRKRSGLPAKTEDKEEQILPEPVVEETPAELNTADMAEEGDQNL